MLNGWKTDEKQAMETIAADVARVGDKWYPIIEGKLPSTGFINALPCPTMADLAVVNIGRAFLPFGACNLLSGYDPMKKYPKFAAHIERVAQHVSVKDYLEKGQSMNADPWSIRGKTSSHFQQMHQ